MIEAIVAQRFAYGNAPPAASNGELEQALELEEQ